MSLPGHVWVAPDLEQFSELLEKEPGQGGKSLHGQNNWHGLFNKELLKILHDFLMNSRENGLNNVMLLQKQGIGEILLKFLVNFQVVQIMIQMRIGAGKFAQILFQMKDFLNQRDEYAFPSQNWWDPYFVGAGQQDVLEFPAATGQQNFVEQQGLHVFVAGELGWTLKDEFATPNFHDGV